MLHLRANEGIFSLESLVGEGRLHAVRFFGNLAAVGTLFLFDGYLIKIVQETLKC